MTTYDLIVVTAAGLTNQHTHTIKTRFHAKGWKLSEKSYRRGIRAICCAGVGVTLKWHRMQFPSGSKSQQKSRTSVLASELEASRREQPGATRSSQEQPGATRSSQEQPGAVRSCQAVRDGTWRYLAVLDGIWRYLAVLGGTQESV